MLVFELLFDRGRLRSEARFESGFDVAAERFAGCLRGLSGLVAWSDDEVRRGFRPLDWV